MIKFSLVVPIYNSSENLEKCLNSIYNQTYSNYEVILINDGSEDNSIDICNKYKTDNTIIIDKENEGVCIARNIGIKKASGDYIVFVDSDDWLDLDFLKHSSTIINKNKKIDLIKYNYITESSNKSKENKAPSCIKFNKTIIEKDYANIVGNVVSNTHFLNPVWGEVIRKEVIGSSSFKQGIIYGEDFLFNIEILSKCNSIYFSNKALYHYLVNEFGINLNYKSDTLKKKIENLNLIYPMIIKYSNIINYNCREQMQRKYIKELTENLVKMCTTDEKKKVVVELLKEIRENNELYDNVKNEKNYKYNLVNNLLKRKKYNQFYFISKYLYKISRFLFK